VIIPTYYRNKRTQSAIETVIEQDYNDLEIIVVDDSGEGHAKEVVDTFEDVQYVEHEVNKGPNKARTTGVNHSSGDYIHFLDDDDRFLPGKIEKSISKIQSEDIGVVYTAYINNGNIITPGDSARDNAINALLRDLKLRGCNHSTMLIEREVLDSIMPLESRASEEGLVNRIELAKRTRFGYIDEPLVEIGVSEDSRSAATDTTYERIRVIKRYKELYYEIDKRLFHSVLQTWLTNYSSDVLQREFWSPKPIKSSMSAIFHMVIAREISFRTIVIALISPFGNPGYQFARTVETAASKTIDR